MNASARDVSSPRQRILDLQGGCNFRDVGGYRTEHGPTVQWGRVFKGADSLLQPRVMAAQAAVERLGERTNDG